MQSHSYHVTAPQTLESFGIFLANPKLFTKNNIVRMQDRGLYLFTHQDITRDEAFFRLSWNVPKLKQVHRFWIIDLNESNCVASFMHDDENIAKINIQPSIYGK